MPDYSLDDLEAEAARRLKQKEQNSLTAQAATPAAPPITKTESGLRGASQGATFGFGDELSAGLELGVGKLTGNEAYKGKSFQDVVEPYRQENTAAAKANPISYGAGDVAGSLVVTAPLTALTAAKTAQIAGKTGLLARISGSAAQGAGEGALRAAGEGKDVLAGAGVGGAFGAGGEVAASTIGAISKSIKTIGRNLAEETVVKNTGFDPFALRKIREKGDLLSEAKEVARTLMDEGILNKPQTARMAHTKVSNLLKKTGSELDGIYKATDKLAPDGLLNRNEVLSVVENHLLDQTQFPDIDAVASISQDIQGLLTAASDKKMGFEKLWTFAKELEKRANKFGRATDPIFATKADNLIEAAGAIRKVLKEGIERVNPEAAVPHDLAGNMYRHLSLAETALANKFLKGFSQNKALPRTGLYERVIDSTIGSTPARGAKAGLLNIVSKTAGKAEKVLPTTIRGLSQAAAAKGRN